MRRGISFIKSHQLARFRSPLCGFSEVEQLIEIRTDPLTGERCRINIERTKRPKQSPAESAELRRTVEESRRNCFFCPQCIEDKTPKLPAELGERIRVGRAIVFPNLFPFGAFHAVGVFSEDHYLSLHEFPADMMADCFSACVQYFTSVSRLDPSRRFWHISWNYMQPAASSIIHPHVQILAEPLPTPHLEELMERSREYHGRHGSNYWADLVEAEMKGGERYIGRTGRVHWLASYAPRASREVMGIVEGSSSLAQVGGDLHDLCDGLSRVLRGYHEMGVRSMNFTTFSGPFDESISDFYWLNVRVISRPAPAPFHISDCGFMERLHLEPVIEVMPEDVAASLRTQFGP
ncbi:MAG: hypothetical protein QW567_03320 [Candidatus Hadarchaeales archaeon]